MSSFALQAILDPAYLNEPGGSRQVVASFLRYSEWRPGIFHPFSAAAAAAEFEADANLPYTTCHSKKIQCMLEVLRSESFASDDLILPPPPAASPSLDTPHSTSSLTQLLGSARSESGNGTKLPRLMNVVAPYIPTLPDELHVKVGDIIRVMQVYKYGWCFARYVGKADTPKRVVPSVCLQERQRIVPSGQKPLNSSFTSFNGC